MFRRSAPAYGPAILATQADLPTVAALLAEARLPGLITEVEVDGGARVVGRLVVDYTDGETVAVDPFGQFMAGPTISELRATLMAIDENATIDSHVDLGGRERFGDQPLLLGEHPRSFVVVRGGVRDRLLMPGLVQVPIRCLEVGDDLLVLPEPGREGDVDPLEVLGDLMKVGALGQRTALLAWHDDQHSGVTLVTSKAPELLRGWEAGWTPAGPAGHDDAHHPVGAASSEVRAALMPVADGDAGDDWGADPVRRRASLRRPTPDWPEMVEALALPPVVLDVLAGRPPEGEVLEPVKLSRALLNSASDPTTMPRPLAAFERSAREVTGRWLAYQVASLMVLGVIASGAFAGELPRWVAIPALGFAAVVALEVVLRLRSRRRRRRDAR